MAADDALIEKELTPQQAINNALLSNNEDALVIAALMMTVIYSIQDIIDAASSPQAALEEINSMAQELEPAQDARTLN